MSLRRAASSSAILARCAPSSWVAADAFAATASDGGNSPLAAAVRAGRSRST
jgi:hypothetical protein